MGDSETTGYKFDWVVTREVRFIDNPSRRGYERVGPISISLALATQVESQVCRVSLKSTVRPTEGDFFQSVHAWIEGQFTAFAEEPAVAIDEFSKRHAPVILMPFLRDAIASATARSRLGQLLIPPINVIALLEAGLVQQPELASTDAGEAGGT
ncbi:MAG TPA: hypothetical protein VM737_11620 [Gemmatimonadota bacterium]|nr:hypothetical protein [Gemmatimonadota bacterium]